jgi:hypothetical protein
VPSYQDIQLNKIPFESAHIDVRLTDNSELNGCQVVIRPRVVGMKDHYDVIYFGMLVARLFVDSDHQESDLPAISWWRYST